MFSRTERGILWFVASVLLMIGIGFNIPMLTAGAISLLVMFLAMVIESV